MGFGVIVIATSIALAAAAAAYAILSRPEGNQDNMLPGGADQYNITECKEGMGVKLGYGDARFAGNIIWHGNWRTEEITEKVKGGGKGGGKSKKQVTGYKMHIDIWQGICIGKATILKILTQDKEEAVEGVQTYNDGTQSTFPSFTPFTASPLNPIAHLAIQGWFLGENTNSVPTLHFIMRREVYYPVLGDILDQNLPNGTNAAVVIYDLLRQSGVSTAEINHTSFIAAVQYYKTKGYGLNFVINGPQEAGKAIESVLNDIDASFYKNYAGEYTIRPLDPMDASEATFTKEDMREFSFNRKTWSQVPNFFNGTYLEENDNFAQRTVRCLNPAAIRLAKIRLVQNVDLKRFRDRETATKRLFELMKRNSYPAATVTFKCDLSAAALLPGSVITISQEDYGIVSADFRVSEITGAKLEKQEVTVTATQMIEKLFDAEFVQTGGSIWQDPDVTPVPLTHIRVFEMPYSSTYGFDSTYLLLAAREKLVETSCEILVSAEETQGFLTSGELTTFSQYGTLDVEYGLTKAIDSETGIEFTAYKVDPEFDTISWADLFTLQRFALIDDEIILFRQVIALGGNSYRLLDCVRARMNTEKAVHSIGTGIWLVNIGKNILPKPGLENFWVKLAPIFARDYVAPGDVTPINVVTTEKAKRPRKPTLTVATRAGSTVDYLIYPTTPVHLTPQIRHRA